jgi:hypothetical protein
MKLIDVYWARSVCRLRSSLLLYVRYSLSSFSIFLSLPSCVVLTYAPLSLQLLFSSMSKLAKFFKLVMIFTHRLSLSAFTFVPYLV